MDTPNFSHAAASKISQLLAETLRLHAPVHAQIAEVIKHKIKDQWLDDLEAHTSAIAGPLIDVLLQQGEMPDEVRSLLEQAKRPTAALGSFVQQFLVYGIMFSIASTGLQPLTQELGNTLWSAFPERPLSPSDGAVASVRGIGFGDAAGVDVPQWAIDEAAKSGINRDRFLTMVGTSGLAPALELLFSMARRGIIDEQQLEQGIKEGDIKDKWIPQVTKLRYVQPTPTDFVAAAVREQFPYPDAQAWATKVGLEPPDYLDGNPDWFKLLFDISGRPPGPAEVGRAANRGFIPWEGTGPEALTFQQAIAESDVKTKWTPILRKLAEYFPPNAEIGRLLRGGGLTKEQAVELWKQNGVPQTLAEAYAHIAEIEQITQDRALTKGDILALVTEQVLDDAEAESLLERVGYSGENAKELIGMAHARYKFGAIRRLVNQVSTLYTGRKINAAQAEQAFVSLGLPKKQTDNLLEILTVEKDAHVLIPTAGQVEAGFAYGVVDYPTASAMLQQLGYSEWSAWFALSARIHGPIPNVQEPPRPATLP